MAAANDDGGETDALSEAEPGDETQPTETQDTDSQGRRRRGAADVADAVGVAVRARGCRAGAIRAPTIVGRACSSNCDRASLAIPGRRRNSARNPDLIAAEEVAEGDVVELTEEALPHEAQPVAAKGPDPAPSAAKETPPAPPPAASDPEPEAERTPVTYNVSPPHDVSGPAAQSAPRLVASLRHTYKLKRCQLRSRRTASTISAVAPAKHSRIVA